MLQRLIVDPRRKDCNSMQVAYLASLGLKRMIGTEVLASVTIRLALSRPVTSHISPSISQRHLRKHCKHIILLLHDANFTAKLSCMVCDGGFITLRINSCNDNEIIILRGCFSVTYGAYLKVSILPLVPQHCCNPHIRVKLQAQRAWCLAAYVEYSLPRE